jgi:16S rRNA (guanine966-N2)-methyltransferase
MRVTAGADRGRKLRAPRGATTRPTAAKVREAIFNILGPPPPHPVLDLFAGSGSLGIEALSRGAVAVDFVERDARALGILHRNLRALGFSGRARVIGASVLSTLQRMAGAVEGRVFGWVFVDPPYASGEVNPVLSLLAGSGLLAEGAVIIVEHGRHHLPAEVFGTLVMTDRRFYGDTGVSFYRPQRELA